MNRRWIASCVKHIHRALRLLASFIILAGCSSQPDHVVWPETATETFRTQYQIDDVNRSITLSPIGGDDVSFPRGESIMLELRNTSGNELAFPNDFGIEGVIYSNEFDSWVEVPNVFIYSPRSRLLGSSQSEIPNVAPVDFLPNETAISGHELLRIIVRGNILEGEGQLGVPVLAYLDVKIER